MIIVVWVFTRIRIMPKDHKRHLISNLKGDFIEIEKPKSKSKPRPIDEQVFLSMVVDRDRLFYREAQERGDTEMMEFLKNRHK